MNETPADDPPDDLALWDLHCFCLGAVRPPTRIVRMEENGRLLHRAHAGPVRRADVSQSTIELLDLYGLIANDGERIRPTFPVIGPADTRRLRSFARKVASCCLPHLAAPVAGIVEALRRQGLSGHAPTVVFGHALDTLMWTILASHDALPDTRLTLQRPFWNGTFWALYPRRRAPAGVNEKRFGDLALVMVWTPETDARLKQLAQAPRLETALLRAIAGDAKIAIPELAHWRLSDDQGRPLFPIIRTDPADLVHELSLAIAHTVANALLAEPLPPIGGIADFRDARVIFGHELIWEIMDELREGGHLGPPARDSDTEPALDIFVRIDLS